MTTWRRNDLPDAARRADLRAAVVEALGELRLHGSPLEAGALVLSVLVDAAARARGLPAGVFFVDELRRVRLDAPAHRATSRVVERFGAIAPEDLGFAHEVALSLAPRDGARDGARRAQGSYYTPAELTAALLDRALEPLLDETIDAHAGAPVAALLRLAIVDPACGGGHLLVAAWRRLAARVARLRAGPEVTEDDARRALIDTVGALHGIDLDPIAAEVCRATIWLSAASTEVDLARLREHVVVVDALAVPPPAAPAPGGALARVLARGGFDLLVGNPPWIAYAGRAAQPLTEARRAALARHEAFAGYPTLHGLFVAAAPSWLRPGGRLALVIPSSVSELAGYRAARRAHDRACVFDDELVDFGEGRFEGVTQPCMALVSRRADHGRRDAAPGEPWPVARPELGPVARRLLARMATLPVVPAALFGERGLQSDRALAAHLVAASEPNGRFTRPLRQGADVGELRLSPPTCFADPRALGSRLRAPREYADVAVLVRQTARFPIAARSDGLAFRNSLLAAFELPGWPASATAAWLNSSLIRWLHFQRFRDARQPVLPQVKISHLRALPSPPGGLASVAGELERAALRVASGEPGARAALDEIVAELYALDRDERAEVAGWHASVSSTRARRERSARPRR